MLNDYSKYFFAPGSRSPVILNLKKYLNTLTYIRTKNKLTDFFDPQMQTSLAEYQKYHRLIKQDGSLNAETYMQFGKTMSDVQIDMYSLNQPDLNKLFYGVDLVDVCGNWDTVATFITKENFIGWNNPTVKSHNCYDYCVKQLKNAGYSLKSPGWSAAQVASGAVYQLYLAQNVGKMKKGYQAQQFTAGILYLKKAIQSKIPVMVGVEHSEGNSSADKTTDHYVVIVGMGSDANGKYFHFYDNSTQYVEIGTSPNNKLYCDCVNFTLSGTGDKDNSYLQSGYGKYIVTQIRESK